MTIDEPARAFSAREAIRTTLAGLALAAEKRDPGGVSCAAMAAAVGVSPTSFARYLSGERPFNIDHLPHLPGRAYRLALAAVEGCRRASAPAACTPDSRLRRLQALLGEASSLLDRFLADDGELDAQERARLAAALSRVAAEALEGASDLTRGAR